MATHEHVVANGGNHQQLDIDPNVRVPDHVAAAAAAADAAHKALYTPQPPAEPAASAGDPQQQIVDPPVDPNLQMQQPVSQDQGQAQQPVVNQDDSFTGPADSQSLKDSEWARRYNSMRGRYEASIRDKGAMEEQMRQLAHELERTQALLASANQNIANGGTEPVRQPQHVSNHEKLITDADRENYGEELLDVVQRAAREVVAPQLHALQEENRRLTARVQNTGKRELFQQLDRDLPNWRELNRDAGFKAWLRLPNIYTGQVRGQMLDRAVNGANAPQVLQLFRDYIAEAMATGRQLPGGHAQEQQVDPAPRAAAVPLETIAAPGRARPASGDSQVPSEKPFYTRAQIATFFDEKRRGLWAHRAKEAQDIENDLSLAQREGRIR